MTREEIIQGLQFTIDMFLSDPLTGEALEKPRNDMDKTTIDACKGAIELLEQQSCYNPDEWCHDCKEYDHEKHCCPRYNKVIRNTVEEMKEPKQRVGHWIKYGIPRCGEQHYKCTLCGYYINFGQWGEVYTKEFKYCPNCGVKMIEPQESEG